MLPQAHVYSPERRGTRDLMRRRLFHVRRRGELLAHVQMTHQQFNFPQPSADLMYQKNRDAMPLPFADPAVCKMVKIDLDLIGHYTKIIENLEYQIGTMRFSKDESIVELAILRTMPGIGYVLSATILYEIESIDRFPTVQKFISYCRLVKPKKTSAGKVTGGGGKKIGNPHLKWAFSEAVMLHMHNNAQAKSYMDKLMKKHPKGKAMSIMAAKIARAVYFMFQRRQPFDEEKFFAMAA